MSAVVEVRTYHGAGPTSGNVTGQTIRMKRADDDTQDAAAPVPIPSSGTNYSWRKSLKIYATTGPDNSVENLRLFSDGTSLGVGMTVYAKVASSYTQASATDEAGLLSGAVDVDTFTSVSPLTVQASQVLGPAEVGDGGANQDFLELQLAVLSTSSPGNSAAKTLTYRWDEN